MRPGRRRSTRAAALLAGAGLLHAGAAVAAGRPPASPCTPPDGGRATVRAVGADFGLMLDDGRLLRLAGIDPVRATPGRPDAAETARQHLAAWLVGAPAAIVPLGPADRWNRVPALVFAPAAADTPQPPLSVALALVDAGLARARAEPAAHACWPALLAAEGAARAAGLGLWADSDYAVHTADDLPALGNVMGMMTIVQGRVAHVGRTRARLYIDLGPPHAAVALRVARRASFIVDQLGGGQDGLVGLELRARGVLDDAGGPSIEVTDADQIEIVSRPARAP